MTTPQSVREAFEAWYAADDNSRKSIERDATGYRLIQAESAWQTWQAAWQAALAQQAVEVTEERVDLALAAYNASRGTYSGEVPTDRDDIRAALLAALPGKTEVDRG